MANKQKYGSTMKAAPFQMRSGNNPSPHKFFRGLGRAFRSLLFGPKRRRGGGGSGGGTPSNPGRQARGMHTYYAGNEPSSVTASIPTTTVNTPAGTTTTTSTSTSQKQPRKAQDSYS